MDNDKIIGYLESDLIDKYYPLYNFKTARIHSIFVLLEYRKMGVGTKLFKQFEKHYKSLDVTYFKVTASYTNASAVAFYKKFGFTEYTLGLIKN